MPLKRLLDEKCRFDSKAVALLLEAYDTLVTELGLKAIEEKERAARLIIGLAQDQTDLDAAKLRDGAASMFKEYAEERRS